MISTDPPTHETTSDRPATDEPVATEPTDESRPESKSKRFGISKLAMWLTIAATFAAGALWVVAILIGDNYKPAGYLTDRTFPTAAEPICATARKDLEKFPPAQESATPAARAEVIEGTTDRLAKMLDDLRLVVPATSDAKWINTWIDDWEIHLADRRDFADRLRTKGRSQEFLETVKYDTQISKSLDHYADINKMLSCQTPGDV